MKKEENGFGRLRQLIMLKKERSLSPMEQLELTNVIELYGKPLQEEILKQTEEDHERRWSDRVIEGSIGQYVDIYLNDRDKTFPVLIEKEYDPKAPIDLLTISEKTISVSENFENLLDEKAKKIYLTPAYNTVYEYVVYSKFGYSLDWLFNSERFNKLCYRDTKNQIPTLRYQQTWFGKLAFKLIKPKMERTADLVQFIVIDVEYTDFVRDVEHRYYYKLSKLFNFLCKHDIVHKACLTKLMILKHDPHKCEEERKRCSLILYPVVKRSTFSKNGKAIGDYKMLNDFLKFEVFCKEGQSIKDFDWSRIQGLEFIDDKKHFETYKNRFLDDYHYNMK